MNFIENTFRYLSSFGGEQLICHYPSKVGPDIEVCQVNGRYQINAGNVNYSFGPLHDAFRRYFNIDPPLLKPDQPVLILGFGGGSIATILREERGIPNPIVGVEFDEMMIRAGKEHFGIGKLSDVTLVHQDAIEFLSQCDDKFALIITDIYIDEVVPPQFEQKEFLERIGQCLLPGGKFVFNKLVGDFKADEERHRLEALFNEVFTDTMTYRIPVNKKMPNYMLTGIFS
ncbi:MAG: spermidine synthase [Bacteroidetes bacterium]|nr:MAG: spermidine synthase [Bacteroidota bacterium]